MSALDLQHRLAIYQGDLGRCTRCVDAGLLHVHEHRGCAKPILQRGPTGRLGVLIVGEAPNFDDSFNADKGYLTYDAKTDPTGRFFFELLVDIVGLTEQQAQNDLLFANAVACLPKRQGDRHPVTAAQLAACRPWLERLIQDAEPSVVVAMGAKALHALGKVEKHGLTLQKSAGKLHDWYGRRLLPVYHPGLLGRVTRKADQQRQDILALRDHLGIAR